MKMILVLSLIICGNGFAATSIKSVEGPTHVMTLKSISESSLNWYFHWGQGSDSLKYATCNTMDVNVKACASYAEKGFRIDKDTVCRVTLERLGTLRKGGSPIPSAEVATVDCESGDRSFQLNDLVCFYDKSLGKPSQSLTFNKGTAQLGKFSISCGKKL